MFYQKWNMRSNVISGLLKCILTNFRFGLSSQASINRRYKVRYPVRANLHLDTYGVEIMIPINTCGIESLFHED